MKIIIGVLLFSASLIIPITSYSDTNKDIMCKQKEVPVIAEFVNDSDSEIVIKYRKKLQLFEVINVRGLDGLVVNSFEPLSSTEIKMAQEDRLSISVEEATGLQYLVIDFKFKEDNTEKTSSVTLPLGKISRFQEQERAKNIKTIEIRRKGQVDQQGSVKNSGTKRIHKTRLE